jgi:hypothetical protein
MTMNYQRLRIMESLSALDALQAEKVLMYIQGLSRRSADEEQHRRLKNQAMKEIRSALGRSYEV